MAEKTVIQVKRSSGQFVDKQDEPISYGEPNFLKSKDNLNYNDILAFGNNLGSTENTLKHATFFEGHNNIEFIGHGAYFNKDKILVDKENNFIKTNQINLDYKEPNNTDKNKYWLVTCDPEGNIIAHVENQTKQNGIYISGNGVLHGGAWNDYAERRLCISGDIGNVVCEQGDGTLALSTEKLQPLPYVISDTYGMIIGPDGEGYKAIALSGKVLVKVNCEVKLGDVLCADKDGFATVMTRAEIANYPDRIIGIVSEIPTYDKWNNVEINDRVWITIK